MTTLLVPMGAIEFTTADIALILTLLVLATIVAALPVSVPFALYGGAGARADGRSPSWNGFWFWLSGTLLTAGSMYGVAVLGVELPWLVPLGWLPGLALILPRILRRHGGRRT